MSSLAAGLAIVNCVETVFRTMPRSVTFNMLFRWFVSKIQSLVVLESALAATFAFGNPIVFGQTDPDRTTAGEKFKSIMVLTEMPADQMGKVMNLMSASLGVNCNHCHEGTDFAKDSVGLKEESRKMLAMTLELNRRFFGGKTEITCNTCHRGKPQPDSKLNLEPIALSKSKSFETASALKDPPNLGAESVWARYLDALGGKSNLAAIRSRHVVAKRIEPNGKSEPEELWQSKPNLSRMTTQYATVSVIEGYDGNKAWKAANTNTIALKSDEAEQIRAEAILAFGEIASAHYRHLVYLRSDRIQDRDVHVLGVADAAISKEQWCFDVQSGLLIRRVASVPTVLGAFDYQVDYHDYQLFGGIMQPTRIQFCVPNISWTRQVESIETNVDIDEKMFRSP